MSSSMSSLPDVCSTSRGSSLNHDDRTSGYGSDSFSVSQTSSDSFSSSLEDRVQRDAFHSLPNTPETSPQSPSLLHSSLGFFSQMSAGAEIGRSEARRIYRQDCLLYPERVLVAELGEGATGTVVRIRVGSHEYAEKSWTHDKELELDPEDAPWAEDFAEAPTRACSTDRIHSTQSPETPDIQERSNHLHLSFYHPSPYLAECYGLHDGHLVMKAYAKTLASHIKRDSCSERHLLQIAISIAKGLKHLHALGIRHEDLKPQNVFIDAGGAVALGDFGALKQFADLSTASGTPSFMSPETYSIGGYEKLADGSSDIWSFGMTLLYCLIHDEQQFPIKTIEDFVLLTDRVTFRLAAGETPQSVLDEKIETALMGDPRNAKYPIIVGLMKSCQRLNPEERPSIDQLIGTMEELLIDLDSSGTTV